MPRRTGIEVLQVLDSPPPNVILMSAYRFEGEDKRSVGHKVFSHMMKPVAPRQLLDEVKAAIDGEDE
jgi:CheY-like chemotaxis protein